MKYKRILLKLSGEALMGARQYGIDPARLKEYATEIKEVVKQGVEVAIVIGGGNIFRGVAGASNGMDRVQGDYMGMLATVINSLALQSALEDEGIYTRLQTAIKMEAIAEPFIKRRAVRHLEKGRVVIFEGTRVDGIYTADPEKDKNAVKFENITFDEAIDKNLKVMDMTAFTLSQENKLPIIVFDMNKKGNLAKVVAGENVGTIVNI